MKFKILALAAAMTLGLAGCGGGDGNDGGDGGNGGTPPPPVVTGAGFYNGMTTEANGNLVATTLAFADGSYYALFTADPITSAITPITAFVIGTGTYDSGNFTSTNARLFTGGGSTPVTFSASYTVKTSITGKIGLTDPAETVGFTGAYDATYEATPSLSAIAGAFTGSLGSTEGGEADDVALNISNTGAVNGSTSGCSFSGTATPKTSGNAYDLQITLGAAPCVLPGKTVSGAALFRGSVLLAIATTPDGTSGFFFEGTKAVPK